ncbi:MAG: DUF4105 domain-containing protein [Chitinophagaceae bacterium]|nr:MAG: DUF4105 domain-containing protein [Chitinophagaceae bacterium]
MKKIVLLVFGMILLAKAVSAQDSCGLRISLLTCSPGDELYSTFGHTAIRVTDAAAGIDEVYNYGTFAFTDDFYYKFVKGRLLYELSVEDFSSFVFQYQAESRSIWEQELAVNCLQKAQLYAALRTNALPENRFYRYDFLFDNCTTRARDMMAKNSGGTAAYPLLFAGEAPTFRNLIHGYLNRAHQDWSKFGIDLLLGAKLDRKTTNLETTFLPDNLLKAFDSTTVSGSPLVKEETPLLVMPSVATESYLITPFVLFALLLFFGGVLTFVKKGWARKAVTVLDFFLLFVLGAVGVLLLFMWFATDHALCANNYNLAWALPTHVVVAFFLFSRKKWVQVYFRILFFLQLVLLLLWAFLPQQLNTALIPLLFLLVLRSWVLSKKPYGDKTNYA